MGNSKVLPPTASKKQPKYLSPPGYIYTLLFLLPHQLNAKGGRWSGSDRNNNK